MKGNVRQDVGLLILRIGLGLTMLYFGSQKMLGVFGGHGYSATVNGMHSGMGIPIVFAHLAIFGEFLGGLGVLFGFLTIVASLGVACTMGVATYMNMRGPGTLSGIFTGSANADPSKLYFPAMLCALAVALMLLGPGGFSLDRKFFRKGKK
jgi:putative oxidoreductase